MYVDPRLTLLSFISSGSRGFSLLELLCAAALQKPGERQTLPRLGFSALAWLPTFKRKPTPYMQVISPCLTHSFLTHSNTIPENNHHFCCPRNLELVFLLISIRHTQYVKGAMYLSEPDCHISNPITVCVCHIARLWYAPAPGS